MHTVGDAYIRTDSEATTQTGEHTHSQSNSLVYVMAYIQRHTHIQRHSCIHTYILHAHTYIHTCMHTSKMANIQTHSAYIHPPIYIYKHTYNHTWKTQNGT